jgi:hypothetical protein
MAEQTLGAYAFMDDPEKMGIPESKKTVSSVNTYSSAAVFQWPAIIAGQQLDLFWSLMEVAQYESLRTLYLSDAVITWIPKPATLTYAGASYQVAVVGLEGVYNEATFHHQPYRFDVTLSLLILSEAVIPQLVPDP